MSVIAIKLHLFKEDGSKTAHRFRGAFQFDELVDTVNKLLTGVEGCLTMCIALTYKDCDGDEVSLVSPLEWQECLLLHEESGEKTLQLTAKPSTSSAASVTAFMPSSARTTTSSVPEFTTTSPVATTTKKEEPSSPKVEGGIVPESVRSDVEVDPFPDEIRLANMMSSGEVPPLQDIITASCAAMDRGAYATAETILEAALGAFPNNRIVYYNMACVCSLDGSKDRALHMLDKAVTCGYNNADHLQQDGDLESIRNDERFGAILQRLGVADFHPSASAGDAYPNNAPKTPRDVTTLLEMFPGLEKENAAALLSSYHNDVDRVVAKLLE